MDLNFPVITYDRERTQSANGEYHGETFRDAIQELAGIRKQLMHERNPNLKGSVLADLSAQQWAINLKHYPNLSAELEGIRRGSDTSIEDIVILNNYTDFRDIQISDQGCSTVFMRRNGQQIGGQTWDMHSSAMRFVCVLHIPEEMLLFSLVGCLGMMGFHRDGRMVGVNNLNSTDARPGVIWPALVRSILECATHEEMRDHLCGAKVTSAHSYLIADQSQAQMWEVLPSISRCTHHVDKPHTSGHFFHTNHCLDPEVKCFEAQLGKASTSLDRYDLLHKKLPAVNSLESMQDLLCDHENYPRSICSHYESGSQDPSFTCGGAAGELTDGNFIFWRGCRQSANYVEYNFKISSGKFEEC